MPKSKLILSIVLIVLLSLFLVGCSNLVDFLKSDQCCFSGLLPLPIAVIAIKIFK